MNKVYERWWDSDKQQWMYREDETIARLRAALEAAKIPHYVCEDCFYSCPKSGECCNEEADGKCWCGADAHNAKIDEALNAQ